MKQQIKQLIDRVAKEICVCSGTECRCARVKSQVMIGDVLEKLKPFEDFQGDESVSVSKKAEELLKLWQRCGFTKSLNELYAEEWERVCKGCGSSEYTTKSCCPEHPNLDEEKRTYLVPKSKEIKTLFQFLLELNPQPPCQI